MHKTFLSNKHICDSVTVCGKRAGGKFLYAAKNQLTFLNMRCLLQPVTEDCYLGQYNKLFTYKPEDHLKNKNIRIRAG
jgi:hypothetical protein